MKKFFKILFGTLLIFALLINALITQLTLHWNNTQYLYDLPDSVWYSEETNMKATVYADYGETPYMLIVDLDDGREYKVLLDGRDKAVFCKGDSDNGNDLYCKCGTSLEVKRLFLKVRGFEIDAEDGCTHFPCDAEFKPDTKGITKNMAVPELPPSPPVIKPDYYNEPKVQPKLKSEYQYLFDAYNKSVDGIVGYFEVLDLGGKRYALCTLKDRWYGELLYISESDGKILFEETAAGGFIDRFDVEYVEMSQGNFIAAICTTHVGNGDLRLIPIDEDTKIAYEIPASRAMYGNEWLNQFNYLFEYGSDSTDFYGGHMTPDYKDVNGDGHTDIVLTGIQFVRNRERTGIVAEYDCEYVYIYDAVEDEFILDVSRSRHDEL